MCIPHRSKRPIVSRPGVPPYCRKIGRFCFKCPTDSLKIADVYPMSTRRNAWGARACGLFAPLRRPPGGLPFSNVKRPRNACCAGALRLFPVPDAGDMVSPKRRNFRFFQLAAQSERGLPFREGRAETAGSGAGDGGKGRRRGEGVDPKSGNFRKESNTI